MIRSSETEDKRQNKTWGCGRWTLSLWYFSTVISFYSEIGSDFPLTAAAAFGFCCLFLRQLKHKHERQTARERRNVPWNYYYAGALNARAEKIYTFNAFGVVDRITVAVLLWRFRRFLSLGLIIIFRHPPFCP